MTSLRLLVFACLAAMLIGSPASGEDKKVNICWGDEESVCQSTPKGFKGLDRYFDCGEGGNSKFSETYVCEQVCGTPKGAHCKAMSTASWIRAGGACRYRWAVVTCK